MIHELHRCKHCRSVYSYQASREGCFREENNKEYCPECTRAINAALKAIPVHYCARYKEIKDSKLLKELSAYKEQQEKELSRVPRWIWTSKETSSLDFDKIELYHWDDRQYAVCYNCPSDKHLFILEEWDIINKEFTGKHWNNYTRGNFKSFTWGDNFDRSVRKVLDKVTARPMSEASCKLFNMDFDWEVVTKRISKHKEK